TLRSLRRAVALGDGWCPFYVAPAQAAEWLARVDVPDRFQVVLPPTADRRLDPIGEPGHAKDAVAASIAAGATIVSATVAHRSLAHYLEQLDALAALTR